MKLPIVYKLSLAILFIGLSLSGQCANTTEPPSLKIIKFEINSLFERNNKIWGTYRLAQEEILSPPHTKPLKSNKYEFPKETLILKSGVLTLISSLKNDTGLSKLWVKSFSYEKTDDRFLVDIAAQKLDFWHLLRPRIEKMLSTDEMESFDLMTLTSDDIEMDTMLCSKAKSGIQCQIFVVLSIPYYLFNTDHQ